MQASRLTIPAATGPERQRWYREVYLQSSHWRAERKAALARAGHRCQLCNGAKSLDVHHRTYERLGEEWPADTTVLCRRCHEVFHGSRKPKPSPSTPRENWSTLTSDQRDSLVADVLKLLVDGPLGTKVIAGKLERRAQVIGSCLGSLHRRKLVTRPKKAWALSSKGRKQMGIAERIERQNRPTSSVQQAKTALDRIDSRLRNAA